MTIEEKLQHFYDSSMEAAKAQASDELSEQKKTLEEMLAQHKQNRRKAAEAEIKAETENARREINKALSAEQLTIKRHWNKKQHELKEKLFAEVKELLIQFTASPEYEAYLCAKINEAKKFAGEDEMQIYLTPADSSKISALSAKTGAALMVSEIDFLGGIRAVIPHKNILIDNSFLESFCALSREFKFDGGPQHE